jgi:beta-lactamase class C
MNRRALFLATIVFGVCGSFLQAQPRPDHTRQVVGSALRPWIQKEQPPGVIVVVHRHGATEFFPFGEANVERRVPVTADSIFELASITKVFATTSLAIEVKQGRMHLQDPVAKYLPALGQGHDIRHVTLEQLATHTSSLPRTPPAHPNGTWDRPAVMQWLAEWQAPHPPGTKSLYSNLAVGVLGFAIAQHEHKPLQEVWDRQLLHPLGMQHTFFEIPAAMQGQLVQGYSPKGRPVERAVQNGGWPAGGRLCSSGRDMAKFLKANLGEDVGHPLITQAMHFAQQPRFKASERITQGLCWQRVMLDGELVIDKNGGLTGTSTYIGMVPGKKTGVVVMANRGKCNATAIGRRLLLELTEMKAREDAWPAPEEDE